ncbi:probable peptidoglycan muropeptide transporter SLC46 isoform X1 [Diabrotica undecimpunctata]|uniref:probable peptidoglycan muropeptide transporter SLC46 isoform X1 n=2 Tax=Diabrotica undecimpunctata TaxID=50387 RepID=UPI003B63449F
MAFDLNKYISVEIPLFFMFVNFLLTNTLLTNLIVYRTCYIILGYNKTACAELGNDNVNIVNKNETEALDKLVVPTADIITMVKTTVESLFPVFVCMVAGPWSDKHGRKPVLLMSLIGLTVGSALVVIFSIFDSINPWYFLIASIPPMLTGGVTTYYAATLSYLTDVSTDETRGLRMACYEGALACGVLIGSIASPYLFDATNYETVFALGCACMLLSLAYMIFFIPESLNTNKSNENSSSSSVGAEDRKLIQLQNFKDMIKTTFKNRGEHKRTLLLIAILSTAILGFLTTGDTGIQYLFFTERFDWTFKMYSLYNSFYYIFWIIGTMGGTYFLHKLLKIRDTILTLVGLVSYMISYIIMVIARNNFLIYSAGVVRCLGGLVLPMLRSHISRIVPADEMGKIFAVLVGGTALISLGASPLYTMVYNATIDTNSSLYNLVSICLIGIVMVFTTIMMCLEPRQTYSLIGADSEHSLITEDLGQPQINAEM